MVRSRLAHGALVLALGCLQPPAAVAQPAMHIIDDTAPDDGRLVQGDRLATCVNELNRLRVSMFYAQHNGRRLAMAESLDREARLDIQRSSRDSLVRKDANERAARAAEMKRFARARHDEIRWKMQPVIARFTADCADRSVRRGEFIAAGGMRKVSDLVDEDVDGLRANAEE